MVRATHVDNKELQRLLDNALAQHMNRLGKAGYLALNSITKYVLEEFYGNGSRTHGGHYVSIPHALTIDQGPIRQSNGKLWIDYTIKLDLEKYQAITESRRYSIYRWVRKKNEQGLAMENLSDTWAAEFVTRLQWDEGIIGLPLSVNTLSARYQIVSSPIYDLLLDEIDRSFTRRVNKYQKLL